MDTSVEGLCNLLIGSRLLAADEVRQLHQRWQQQPPHERQPQEQPCRRLSALPSRA